jgi:hypothetical protein
VSYWYWCTTKNIPKIRSRDLSINLSASSWIRVHFGSRNLSVLSEFSVVLWLHAISIQLCITKASSEMFVFLTSHCAGAHTSPKYMWVMNIAQWFIPQQQHCFIQLYREGRLLTWHISGCPNIEIIASVCVQDFVTKQDLSGGVWLWLQWVVKYCDYTRTLFFGFYGL